MQNISINSELEAYSCLINGEYEQAALLYEQAIETEPEVKTHYWYLGLVLLLLEQEAEAHTTWLLGMVTDDSEEVEQWTAELVQVLDTEALRREKLAEDSVAWLIRQHLREISPQNIENLLNLIKLAIKLDTLTEENLTEWGVVELLTVHPPGNLNGENLLAAVEKLLEFCPQHPLCVQFAEACLPHLPKNLAFRELLRTAAIKVSNSMHLPDRAIPLTELCLRVDDRDPEEILRNLTSFYNRSGNYAKGIETAKRCYSLMCSLPDKVFANHLLIQGLMSAGGYWEEAVTALHQQEDLLGSLIQNPSPQLHTVQARRLLSATSFLAYFQDRPKQTRQIQNKVAYLCQCYLQANAGNELKKYRPESHRKQPEMPLKIGYLSYCFRSHSVGWLARGLIHHHDRDRFEIHGYFVHHQPMVDPVQAWYENQFCQSHQLGGNALEIAAQIAKDEIDILIDLDSITLDTSFHVMALKPAPIQVTWLGWDALGMPAIDYFMADSYVLAGSAQDYYSEKIYRLPETYIAVDGFEMGVPTRRREDLEIPSDAVVYFSGQHGFKRHPETTRWQMKIIKQVPNSYFLIKGKADEAAVKNFFIQIATEEGVSSDRLRFLPRDPSELIHRANLGIADVVLDTYPYNGATTTMETLWMGIPMVTRVGEQFSARNSYTMMINAGVKEGIAWTDEEYIEWGVRLGLDPTLRQQISWKLRQGRQTAPLWNAKQFTRHMENAYEQMWQNYLCSQSKS